MKHPSNIRELIKLPVDFIGFIFYAESPRYIGSLNPDDLEFIPSSVKRTGVFVNAQADYIKQQTEKYDLDIIQLHGSETAEFCEELNRIRPVIKAINISSPGDFEDIEIYEKACDYFLFDTKTQQHGGSGKKFDWSVLEYYKGSKPFFLSGGISSEDVAAIKEIKHPQLYGIDLNSKFESEPGLKNIQLLEKFIKEIQS